MPWKLIPPTWSMPLFSRTESSARQARNNHLQFTLSTNASTMDTATDLRFSYSGTPLFRVLIVFFRITRRFYWIPALFRQVFCSRYTTILVDCSPSADVQNYIEKEESVLCLWLALRKTVQRRSFNQSPGANWTIAQNGASFTKAFVETPHILSAAVTLTAKSRAALLKTN